ncbi:laminin subunit beta-1-like [Lytechinus variegatus]|uniref:laminin subunit beta-1-like n=1 Tax=Lytechinus variegatus TaxID=7654 RepID=UPI001BB21DF8|nr:laminin subunit beta-1-like [Lytechinus variegatus]
MRQSKGNFSSVPRVQYGVVFCVLSLTLLLAGVEAQLMPVNVALNKPISANITCGDPPELFTAHIQQTIPAEDRVSSLCNASNPSLAHPPGLMVDEDVSSGVNYTWWQSTSRSDLIAAGFSDPESEIILDLQEVHSVESISIQMGDSVRPGQIGIRASQDGINFRQLLYQVSDETDCSDEFDVSPTKAVVDLNTVLCSTYLSDAQQRNEIINFPLSPPTEFQEWQRARFLKIDFYNMPRSFGFFSNSFHHYTVRNLEVMAQCECNGHATSCTLQPLTSDPTKMTYQCVCGDSTQGDTCSECLPFYNQLAYQPGTDGFVCEECNCFNHSDVCQYNESVAATGSSLNAAGEYIGGGVCLDCRDNTAGINCHQCVQFYFRPTGTLQSDMNACQECNCYLPGTREDPSTGLVKGECVMNDDDVNPAGMSPGDCYCKVNVQGSKCNECKDGFYDLTDANTNGCLGCDCFTDGTIQGSEVCEKNSSGQCPCKEFTQGRRCDECQDGYYGLSGSSQQGCTDCQCDVGGAENLVCDKTEGVCTCRSRVIGRRCDSVGSSSFYPTLHSINTEFESMDNPYWKREVADYSGIGYVELSGSVNTSTVLTVPPSQFSGEFQLVLRAITEGISQVDFTIQSIGEDIPSTVMRGQTTLPVCSGEWCYDGTVRNTGQPELQGLFVLTPGDWRVTAAINTQGGARVLLDQLVALPVEYIDPGSLLGDGLGVNFTTTCDLQTNNMRLGTPDESFCLANVFSLTTYYFDGAQECDCDLVGSVGLSCTSYGGQCTCKGGVGGRTCDSCLPEFFSFRSTGCTSCDCFGDDKVCDVTTGQCNCPTNTAGRRCDRCVTFTWGLNSTTGCKECQCNPTGSIRSQCDQETGQCPCKPGVTGRDCSECLPGFKDLTDEGCIPCDCDVAGSLSDVCNAVTGQCMCKSNTVGLQCDSCMTGSFYINPSHQAGCLDCVCMGITNQCDSTTQRSIQYTIPTTLASVDLWEVFVPTNILDPPPAVTSTVIANREYVSVILNEGIEAFWRLPADDFSGSLLGLYGQMVTFDLVYFLEGNTNSSAADPVEATMSIQSQEGELSYQLGILYPGESTTQFIEMSERSGWVSTLSGQSVSRSQFLTILTNVNSVLVSATLSSAAHASSIGIVSYYKSTPEDSPNYEEMAPRALAVEQCTCGPQYSGLSCEECASGFYRVNTTSHPFFGVCIACECNGHSSTCDPSNGQCLDCQNNTGGFNCEVCLDGFYGDATSGAPDACQECPCGPPKSQSNQCSEIDGVVTCQDCLPGHLGPLCNICADFYYGEPANPDGFCQQCECNGNTDTCDSITGQCIGCRFSTTGFNCEQCQNFTYGNASQQNCQACNCDPQGSTNLLCDHETGQCPCLPGVGGMQCDACLPNYYGFGNSSGCVECGCNEYGSQDLQCDVDGVCRCLAGVLGVKCDTCEDGSYGLPDQSCLACGCDGAGSNGGSQAVCDVRSGQCPCKTGITGRLCDECRPGFINFSSNGCTKCDQCVDTLYNSTRTLETLHTQLLALGASIQELQRQDTQLRNVDPLVVATSDALDNLQDQYTSLRTQIENIDIGAFERNVSLIAGTASNLSRLMVILNEQASSQLDQMTIYRSAALQTMTDILSASSTVQDYITTLTNYNSSAAILMSDALVRRDDVTMLTISGQMGLIETELGRIRNVTMEADSLLSMVLVQGRELNRLMTLVSSAESQLQATRELMSQTYTALEAVQVILDQTDTVINHTQTNQAYSNRLLDQAETQLAGILQTFIQALQAIGEADQAIQDANAIYIGSSSGSANLPMDVDIDDRGINGWFDGNLRVRGQLGAVQGLQANLEIILSAAESRALFLSENTAQSLSFFQSAQPQGQLAVDTVRNYRSVVTTVQEAKATNQNATDSLASTRDYLITRPVPTLSEEAQRSLQLSNDLVDSIDGNLVDTQGLMTSLDSANQTLQSAIESWDIIRQEVANLEAEVNTLSEIAANPDIQPAIDSGMEVANETIAAGDAILESNAMLTERLTEEEQSVVFIQDNIRNATTLITGLPSRVSQIESDVETLSTNVDTVLTLRNHTGFLRSGITNKIARLREKLQQAQTTIADSDQPVRLGAQSPLTIITPVDTFSLSNEIQLDVRPEQRDGLLFFMGNPTNNVFMSIEIIASRVNFKFRVNRDVTTPGQDVVTVSSPIDVCCGDWYRILATRYGNGGELTVTLLSTGGSSTNYARILSVYNGYMILEQSSTFFIGGIPTGYQIDEVTSYDFEGCIGSVTFDGQKLDLWRPTSQEGSQSCCGSPVTVPEPVVNYVPGVSFDGSGYYRVPKDNFDVYNESRITLEFRTVLKEGVLFAVTRPDLISFIGIFMINGQVIFEMNTAGNARYSVPSISTYNDGQWYQVTAGYNSSHYSFEIRYANGSNELLEASTRRTLAPLSFPNLQFSPKIFLGGADPVQLSNIKRGPTRLSFAGNLRHLSLSNGASVELVPREITNTSSFPFKGISFNGYPEEVVRGIGFAGDFAYMSLSTSIIPQGIETIQLRFKTTQPHGLLVYGYDTVSFNKLVYVTLYHGNVFVQYNLGGRLSDPMQTRGLKLNTGQWQDIAISFNGLTASLKVNDLPMIYGAVQLTSPSIDIEGLLFIGGLSANIPGLIGGDFPVRQSLEGDIVDLLINDVSPHFNDPNTVLGSLGVTLTGVQPEVMTLPPLPYSTPPPPTDDGLPGACASPIQVITYPPSEGVVRFGLTRESYLGIALNSEQRKYFESKFIIEFEFRALSSNGILLYVANDYSRPNQFMALVMQNGYLNLFIFDQSRVYKHLTSAFQYNDAQWRTATILKINGFVVLFVPESKDYNGLDNGLINNSSRLEVGTSLYIGGLGPQVRQGSYPLNRTLGSFNGCIRQLNISTESSSRVQIPLNSPGSDSANITECRFNPIGPGSHFDGSGWLLLRSSYTLVSPWSVSMTISTTDENSLLLALSADLQNFITLEIVDGTARAVVGLGTPSSVILWSTQMTSVCDDNPHTITLAVRRGLIEMTIDDNPTDSLPVSSDTFAVINDTPLYIGGISDAANIPLVPGIIRTPFNGCLLSLTINDVPVSITTHEESRGYTVGCPRPIPI